jgi:hypothetical protein
VFSALMERQGSVCFAHNMQLFSTKAGFQVVAALGSARCWLAGLAAGQAEYLPLQAR